MFLESAGKLCHHRLVAGASYHHQPWTLGWVAPSTAQYRSTVKNSLLLKTVKNFAHFLLVFLPVLSSTHRMT